MQSYDVLIIGNGVLGLSTAYALTLENPSLTIAIIGPDSRMGGATIAAGAMLGCFGEVTSATFQSKFGLAKLEMAIQAAKLWPDWLNSINNAANTSEPLRINLGSHIILNTESAKREDENYAAIIKALNFYNEPYQEVDPREIQGLNPIDNCRPLRSVFLPNEGSLNPTQIISYLDNIINRSKNITTIDETVTQVYTKAGRIDFVQTDTGKSFTAQHIVLASGAYSQSLIDQIPQIKNEIPRILAGAGSSFIFRCNNHKLRNVVRSPNRIGACGIHMMPYQDNLLFMGASNSIEMVPKTESKLRDCYYLIHRTIEQFNQELHNAEIVSWLMGNRPVTVDTFPLIGETSIEGFWILTGTYRDGFHVSPLLAQSLAKQIVGKQALFKNKFLPERMPIQTMTKTQAIEEFAEQYWSVGYEHSIQLPKVGWGPLLKEIIYKKTQELYAELDTNIALPADILVMLLHQRELIPSFRKYYQSLEHKYPESVITKPINFQQKEILETA